VLKNLQSGAGEKAFVWQFFSRWISEILADFWSVAKVGIASSLGLIGVVSLPSAFVFRVALDDPHPIPWIRVQLSTALGNALYPHPQWARLSRLWESYYPIAGLDEKKKILILMLEKNIPRFVEIMANHQPESLRGKTLKDVFSCKYRQPSVLREYYDSLRSSPGTIRTLSPSLVFAIIGQAKADNRISPKEEGNILDNILRHWALCSKVNIAKICMGNLN
jgi:hypothetical protein